MEPNREQIRKAIEFGAQQAREEAEFMRKIGIGEPYALVTSSVRTESAKTIAALKDMAKAKAKAKAKSGAPVNRRTGAAQKIREALGSGEGQTIEAIAVATGLTRDAARQSLAAMKMKGRAIKDGDFWSLPYHPDNSDATEEHVAA